MKSGGAAPQIPFPESGGGSWQKSHGDPCCGAREPMHTVMWSRLAAAAAECAFRVGTSSPGALCLMESQWSCLGALPCTCLSAASPVQASAALLIHTLPRAPSGATVSSCGKSCANRELRLNSRGDSRSGGSGRGQGGGRVEQGKSRDLPERNSVAASLW